MTCLYYSLYSESPICSPCQSPFYSYIHLSYLNSFFFPTHFFKETLPDHQSLLPNPRSQTRVGSPASYIQFPYFFFPSHYFTITYYTILSFSSIKARSSSVLFTIICPKTSIKFWTWYTKKTGSQKKKKKIWTSLYKRCLEKKDY